MKNAKQLTIDVAEGDRVRVKLLYQVLMDAARQAGIALLHPGKINL